MGRRLFGSRFKPEAVGLVKERGNSIVQAGRGRKDLAGTMAPSGTWCLAQRLARVADPACRRQGPQQWEAWPELKAGLRFVRADRLLVVLAGCVAAWQVRYNSATVVNILFATRTLGLSAQDVGLSYVCLGIGTVFASLAGGRLGLRIGPG